MDVNKELKFLKKIKIKKKKNSWGRGRVREGGRVGESG